MNTKWLKLLIIATTYMLASTRPSFAYLDPGTASIVMQSVIAIVAAGTATIGLYWQRFKAFLTGRRQKADQNSS